MKQSVSGKEQTPLGQGEPLGIVRQGSGHLSAGSLLSSASLLAAHRQPQVGPVSVGHWATQEAGGDDHDGPTRESREAVEWL